MWENVTLALSSLKSNKMRAMLTMLGIIIGIMSIIAILIIGDAMTSAVSSNLATLGGSNITVSVQERGVATDDMFAAMGGRGSSRSGKTPTTNDLISDRMIADLRANFPSAVEGVSVSHSAGTAQARDGDLYANVSITGANSDFIKANNTVMISGRFISEADVRDINQSAVVSDRFVNNMFHDGADPIGRQVKIYKPDRIEIYTIIGVYRYESMGFGGTLSDRDLSTTLYIPVSTAKQNLLEKNYTSMTVITSQSSEVTRLTDQLQNYFDGIYEGNTTWRVSVSNFTSMLDAITESLNTISLAIAIIAGISLLVGGIGVMNIMLVSVTERTREIGVRKALGARNYHIQLQFVTEAIIIASIGGIIGLLLGIATGAIIAAVFEVPLVISPLTTVGCVLFSMAIGVFFGLYPANKAAKLDPIEALRYE